MLVLLLNWDGLFHIHGTQKHFWDGFLYVLYCSEQEIASWKTSSNRITVLSVPRLSTYFLTEKGGRMRPFKDSDEKLS